MILTRQFAAGLAFVVIACCGNGVWWANVTCMAIGIYFMLTDRPEVSQ